MKLNYYPGCSMHATGRSYEESIRAVAPTLDLELVEVDDWNCCGATTYMGVDEVLAFALTARNLALVAKTGGSVCTPCSACFTNLRKTEKYLHEYPDVKRKVDDALAAGGMRYDGGVDSRHLLDVVYEDIGLEKLRTLVKQPLQGMRVAPYYGCQMVRPYGQEQDALEPVRLDHLIEALGATATYYPFKTTCCGGSQMGTNEDVALRLCRNLLLAAEQQKADCIVVTCPLCQMNLDAYQARINKRFGFNFKLPIIYFTQLIGLAFGLSPQALGLARCIVPASSLVKPQGQIAATSSTQEVRS